MRKNIKSLLVVIFTHSLLTPALANEPAKWDGTEMTMDFYRTFINEKNCAKSVREYLACVSSLTALVSSIDPKLDIEAQTSAHEERSGVEFGAGNLRIVRSSETAKEKTAASPKDVFESLQKKHSDFKNTFSPTYELYKKSGAPVTADLISFIEKKYKDSIKEKSIAAAVNEYFHVAKDPHSDYRLNKDFQDSVKQSSSSFVGLGVAFKSSDSGILVEQVLENSGASAAGIEEGDVLTDVNGNSLMGISLEGARGLLLGEEGSQIKISLFRDSVQMTKTVIRKKVTQFVVSANTVELFGKKIGYIKYTNFTYEKGCQEIEKALVRFNEENVDGVILDLRNNGGGSVGIAGCIAGLFVGPNIPISYLEMQDGRFGGMMPIVTENEQVFKKALVMLINAQSASASELLSGAMKEFNRAVVVGRTSFGKGSSQNKKSETPAMSFWGTNGLFFMPSGKTNQTVGIKPHLEVYRSPNPKDAEVYAIREKDLFLFPLEPRTINVSYATDKLDKLKISQECVSAKNPNKVYAEKAKNDFTKDLQILNGAAAVGCIFQ